MKTARATGAVGLKAVVPKYVMDHFGRLTKNRAFCWYALTVLDFGCGKAMSHVKAFRDKGFLAWGYDFSLPETINALKQRYAVVYANNVLNVASSWDMVDRTVAQIAALVERQGVAVVNYPASPRKTDMSSKDMARCLSSHFAHVVLVNQSMTAPVWECRHTGTV